MQTILQPLWRKSDEMEKRPRALDIFILTQRECEFNRALWPAKERVDLFH